MTRHGISWPFRLICLFATSTFAAHSLEGRADQSQAVCSPDFDWADNSQNLSPCTITASVWGSCFTGGWNVPALQSAQQQYTNPNSTTANLCTCSWAAYNLISACTACQGFDSAVQNWAAYTQSCGGFLTNTYFPSNITLPLGTAIPFWATTNPQSWNDARFDASEAQVLAKEDKPDVVPTVGSSNKKGEAPPIGAIVGGVVGGLAVLAIGGIIAFWIIRKRKRQHEQLASEHGTHPYMVRPPHGRSTSDVSKNSINPQSLSVMHSQRPGTVYTTNTMHTHTGSAHSLSFVSGYTSPVRVMSPPPTSYVANREDVIEPYILRPTSPPVSMARKTSETTMRTAYNNSEGNTLLTPAAIYDRGFLETSERPRLNPPAYSPYPTPTSSPEPTDPLPQSSAQRDPAMGHRAQHSYESALSGESVSAIDDVIGRMGLTMPAESVVGGTMGGHTVSTGQSATVISRPTHKPNVSNPGNDTLG
ncbi:hypothetical protein B0H11DRAFT_351159 [Mycena galericulata]|nr:hypothetical protein B0H11DRAFT_351159 [Mycena galericulata]